jgi:hypothetical protein
MSASGRQGPTHAFELPNKITMSREDYFVVQQVYRGWNQLGFLLAVQLGGLVAVAVRFWHSPRVLRRRAPAMWQATQ